MVKLVLTTNCAGHIYGIDFEFADELSHRVWIEEADGLRAESEVFVWGIFPMFVPGVHAVWN